LAVANPKGVSLPAFAQPVDYFPTIAEALSHIARIVNDASEIRLHESQN
jgi:hypothetical protein